MSLKVSKYTVVSDTPFCDAEGMLACLVYSPSSGEVLAIPEKAANSLRVLTPPSDIELCVRLESARILLPSDEDELTHALRRNTAAADAGVVASFTIVPTSFCNMACSYCGQEHTKGAMNAATRAATIERIVDAMDRPGRQGIFIRWFGGEPMAAPHVIEEIGAAVAAAAEERGLNFRSGIVTNGSLLSIDKMIVLRRVARVLEYDITIDGPREIHDSRRRLIIKSRKSYDQIVDIVRASIAEPKLSDLIFTIRVNIDIHNMEHVDALIDDLAERGVANSRVMFDLHFVYPWSNDVSNREIPREEFAAMEVEWMRRLASRGMRFMVLPKPHSIICSAVSRHAEVIGDRGDVYSCTEHVLVPKHAVSNSLGTVRTVGTSERPAGVFDEFNDEVEAGNLPCSTCAVFPVCGGACPKHWSEGQPPCPTFKYNMQDRLSICAELHGMTTQSETQVKSDRPSPVTS